MRVPPRLAAVLLALPLAVAFVAPPAAADSPSNGQLLVPGDHHLPGETIEVTGYQLDAGAPLQLSLVSGSRTAAIGSASVLDDGTFSTHATVPADFPTGYADVVATSSGSGTWKTVILVGERAEGPQIEADRPFIDVAALGLLMAIAGILIAFFAARHYLRR